MKTESHAIIIAALTTLAVHAQTGFTNFIRQVQLPYVGVQRDASVDAAGQQESPLMINPGGARFELHTVQAAPVVSYLLDTRYVGAYVPVADIVIRTEDTNSPVPRTRADRPFFVDVTLDGLLDGSDPLAPEASKSVSFLHHIQSYGVGGDDTTIDRTQATLSSKVSLSENSVNPPRTLTYALSGIPGADRSKIRGEERFSVFSLKDYQAPESQIASQTVQIWPVADGTISGIVSGSTIEFSTPTITIAANDLYPECRIYAQVYKGSKRDNHVGTVVPGSAEIINENVPQNRLFAVSDWGSVLDEDGEWTMELLTSTVFGIDRLAFVSFKVDRTISVNASTTTID